MTTSYVGYSQMRVFNEKFSYRIFNQPSNEDIQWQILIFFRIFNQTFSNIQSPNSHKGYSSYHSQMSIFDDKFSYIGYSINLSQLRIFNHQIWARPEIVNGNFRSILANVTFWLPFHHDKDDEDCDDGNDDEEDDDDEDKNFLPIKTNANSWLLLPLYIVHWSE